jgi:TatD DNase family protein
MIDFHCHLDLYEDPFQVAAECKRRGIYVLSVTTTPMAWNGTRKLADDASRIRTALGLHPQLVGERKNELALFDRLLSEAVYVGEIGLDGGPEYAATWSDQVRVFEHILLSCRAAGGRVFSVHSRRATTPVLDSIERVAGAGRAVLHWYSGTKRELARAIDLECWFSVGPAMLRSSKGRMLAAQMPRDRVLTETDGPFARAADGGPMFPWDADDAVDALAEIWELDPSVVRATLAANLKALTSHI